MNFSYFVKNNPVFRLVLQMTTGIILFSVLLIVTMLIGELRLWVDSFGAISHKISIGCEILEDFIFAADALCLLTFVITEVVHFLKSMFKPHV